MENYIVSARKYRPSTFNSVVGQASLTATLKNAIHTNKLAHAYLFCGPRGVGKTTCARIFAKTINCLSPTTNGEACNACESCKAFNEQRSYNIHEMDAASNNSVDEIRQLVEMVRIPPQIGNYSVYIIDEVHMLSTAAFNAFLKTLEEPPRHAIFILATTEKHKIIPTILSRCQIYDFNRISTEDTVAHLTYVASTEGITAEPEALNVIALKADGGMRDALSIFDQVVSFSGGNVTYQQVIDNLNVLDYEYYFKMTDYLLTQNIPGSLLLLNEILGKGFDGSHFITGLSSHFRDLLVAKDPVTLSLLEVGASIRQRYQEQAQRCPVAFLYRAMKLCNDCDLNYRVSKNKRLLLELTLIQVAQSLSDEDGVSGGRGPKKALKPLFNTSEVAQQQGGTPAASQPQQQVQNVQQPVNPQVGANASTSAVVSSSPSPQVIASAAKTPVVNKSMRVSIKSPAKGQETVQGSTANATVGRVTPQVDTARSFTEQELNFFWQEFIGQLPHEHVALSKQMSTLKPSLLNDGVSFEVIVDNEIAAKNLMAISRVLEDYLKKRLSNYNIKMAVKVSEVSQSNRPVSRGERYQSMMAKNPALEQFKEEFGLELY